ncbi:uncharacterized protein LOC121853903 [Homarus americanus]|nr:uncharacterized protein LOC121853903 [Homarus americanus]
MTWVLPTLLVAIYLLTVASAFTTDLNEPNPFDLLQVATEKIFLDDGIKDMLSVFAIQGIVTVAVVIGVIFLFRELGLALKSGLYPEEDSEEASYSEPYVAYYDQPSSYASIGYQSSQRSLGKRESLLTRVLNSIDPVESAFALMDVEEVACRRRTVCELQRAASRMPIIASLVQYISPSISGLEEYKEAQDAGAALEDCALLFSECPTSLVQNVWGDDQVNLHTRQRLSPLP